MTPFGALLRQLRTGRTVTVLRHNASWHRDRVETVTLSQNELARRSGVDQAHVHRLEHGLATASRAVLDRLTVALELDDIDAARLMVAAGYWPWTDLDDDATELALGVVFAIGSGDYRMLQEAHDDNALAVEG